MSSSLYTQPTICAKNIVWRTQKPKAGGEGGDKNATVFQNQPTNIYENGSNKGEICILEVGWGPLSHIISEGSRVFSPLARVLLCSRSERRESRNAHLALALSCAVYIFRPAEALKSNPHPQWKTAHAFARFQKEAESTNSLTSALLPRYQTKVFSRKSLSLNFSTYDIICSTELKKDPAPPIKLTHALNMWKLHPFWLQNN
jgi:hypothetical protein